MGGFPIEELKCVFKFIFSLLRSGVEEKRGVEFRHLHAMPSEFGAKWGAECLNTRFPLHIPLCAGYSVNLIHFFIFMCVVLYLYEYMYI